MMFQKITFQAFLSSWWISFQKQPIEINDINPNKSSSKDSIPPKMLKISSEATANILQKMIL